jgi:hypothetical protein
MLLIEMARRAILNCFLILIKNNGRNFVQKSLATTVEKNYSMDVSVINSSASFS